MIHIATYSLFVKIFKECQMKLQGDISWAGVELNHKIKIAMATRALCISLAKLLSSNYTKLQKNTKIAAPMDKCNLEIQQEHFVQLNHK